MSKMEANKWVEDVSKNVELMIKMKEEIMNRKDITEEMRKALLRDLMGIMEKYKVTLRTVLGEGE